jgi:hypothetical protein
MKQVTHIAKDSLIPVAAHAPPLQHMGTPMRRPTRVLSHHHAMPTVD